MKGMAFPGLIYFANSLRAKVAGYKSRKGLFDHLAWLQVLRKL